MKKFLTIFITPIAMLFLTIVKLPSIEPYLYERSNYSQNTEFSRLNSEVETVRVVSQEKNAKGIYLFGWSISYVLMIQAFIIGATVFTYYATMYSPYTRYEELAKKRWLMLDYYADIMLSTYSDYNISFNILIPKRRYLFMIEPKRSDTSKRKLTLTGKVFDVVWSRGEGVNKKLKLTTKQGVSGAVYEEGKRMISKNFMVSESEHSNFTDYQIDICNDLKMLTSCPIIVNLAKVYKRKTYVLGVLNVEGSSENSVKLIKDPVLREKFHNDVYNLSKICATLLT